MKIINIDELNKLGAGTVFAETFQNKETFEPNTTGPMIRLSDSMKYDGRKIFNGVVNLYPYQEDYCDYSETYSWDCASSDYNKDDKFILYEKKDLIVMRDLLDAAIKSFDTKKFDVDIDKLDSILQGEEK